MRIQSPDIPVESLTSFLSQKKSACRAGRWALYNTRHLERLSLGHFRLSEKDYTKKPGAKQKQASGLRSRTEIIQSYYRLITIDSQPGIR